MTTAPEPAGKQYPLKPSIAAISAVVLLATAPLASAQGGYIDERIPYRMENAGFDRLNQTMCADVVNGGPMDNQLNMQPCADYSGQMWHLAGKATALRHLPTYTLTTEFRGAGMCLTVDGTLMDHVLRLAPCADVPTDNQLWVVLPAETATDGPGSTIAQGWQITPYLDEIDDTGRGFSLVVSAPPEGDGLPYIDTIDYVGAGFLWRLTAW
jgi:hypothetical protein